MASRKTRSKAAKKGWETRRANARKRVLEALKRKNKKAQKKAIEETRREIFREFGKSLRAKVIRRRMKLIPGSGWRAVKRGTHMLGLEWLEWAEVATKEQFLEAAANPAYEKLWNGYNPFWYHD